MASVPFIGEILSVVAALAWAVGVVLFKKSGETMRPLALNLFKNAIGLILLVPTIPLVGEPFVPADQPLRAWILIAGSGVLGVAIGDTLFFVSLEKLGAGLTAVVDTSYTPLMLFLSFAVLGERIGVPVYVGAGLIVLAMLIGSWTRPEPGRTRRDLLIGSIFGVAGIAFMAVGIVMIKGVLNEAPFVWATGLRLAAGVVVLVPIVLVSPHRRSLLSSLVATTTWKYPLAASIIGTYVAMISWIGGMKHVEVSVATTLNQLSTIFIFVLATVFLKERLTGRRLFAIGLAFAGGLLVALRQLFV